MKRALATLAGLLLAVSAHADDTEHSIRLFRYYDADHKVHIDQQVSDDALTYGYDELDKQMNVMRSVAPRPTAKDLERIKAEQVRREQAEEQARADVQLKRLYSSPQDAERTRDGQVDAIQLHIDFSNNSIVRLRSLRAQQAEIAAGYERSGKPVPKDIQDSIQKYDAQIVAAQEDIKTRKADQDDVRSQFATIIQRLRDMQSGSSTDSASSGPATTP